MAAVREGAIDGRLITNAQWGAMTTATDYAADGGFSPGRSFVIAASAACTLNVILEQGGNVAIAIPASGGQATWGGLTAICRAILRSGTTFPTSGGLQIAYHLFGSSEQPNASARD